jgi:outer membrane receptor protein involved in Fe transport
MRLTRISVFILFLSIAVIGQTNKGGISGTVTDLSGAAVPGAKVTVTNVGTNQSVTLTSSESGAFTANSLEPVIYRVTVEAANFKTAVVENIKVDTASTQTVNVLLEAGNIAEKVTIQAETPLLNTETGTLTQTITERQLQDLPLSNRSVLDLAVTTPNVSGDAGSEDAEVTSGQPVPGYNLSLNGGRPGSTSILADGVNNTGVGIARAVVSFTPETVQEFTVQTSAYSAEYGQTGGGVINASTKSGTNDFRATALWYTRNPKFNAQPFRIGTTPRVPNNLRYNQVSVTAGGPVFLPGFGEGTPYLYDGRDKTFFFFAYEPRWRKDFVTTTTLLPTAAERAGDFRNLTRTSSGWLPTDVAARFGLTSIGPSAIYQQFVNVGGRLVPIVLQPIPGSSPAANYQFCQFGDPRATTVVVGGIPTPQCTPTVNATIQDNLNVIPQPFIDPIARQILGFMPTPGDYFLDNGFVRNYIVNREVTQNETRYTLRLDHNIRQNNKINFRYTLTPAIGVRDFGSDVNGSTGVFSDAKQILIGNDYIITPNITNSLKLSYTRGVFSEDFAPEFSINGGRNLASELGLTSVTSGGLPLFQISGDGGYNAFADVGSSGSTNNFNVEERFNINDIVYWSRGSMTWKFGVDLSQARLNVIPFFGASGGRWEFRTLNTDRSRANNVAAGGNNLASLLVGVPNAVQVRPLLVNYDYRWRAGAAFVQNDWKVKPNLTLNLGLRYALQFPRTEKNDLQGVFRLDKAQTVNLTDAQRLATAIGLGVLPANSPAGTAIPAPYNTLIPTTATIPVFQFAGRGGASRYLVPVDYLDFEPRFGFAWSPKFWKWAENRSMVIRGGYGISHAAITGNNRNPSPDFFSFQAASTLANGSTAGFTRDPLQPVSLSYNPPVGVNGDVIQRLGILPDGTNVANSIAISGFVYPGDDAKSIPYTQNWNLSASFEILKNTVVEIAYVGNKGTHLYMPLVNVNPRNASFVELLEANGIGAENTFNDPLGRRSLINATVTVQRNSVTAPYFGFGNLNRFFDPSANSILHAGYIQVQRRFAKGLSFTANYTYGKSIDDSSDASPDVRVLTTGSTLGQVYYGAPRSGDRSLSSFDIKHNFNTTFVWDLPIGRKRWLFSDAPKIVDSIIGGWTVSGVFRLQGGQPFMPFITDTNKLGGVNRTVRLDLVPGVPLKNPRYSSSCPIGAGCEPYINPAAFMRPAKGSLGTAPRTLEVRAPLQEYFDLSIQKTWNMPFIGGEGKRRINFRVDFLNAFNHPNFRFVNTGNTPPGFGTFPTEVTTESQTINGVTRNALITAAEYNAWATANGQPLASTPAGAAQLLAIRTTLEPTRLATGALPLDFFHVNIPEGFATTAATAFDIRTVSGFKLYRLRQTYDTNFGTLFPVNNPRYIQFGLRLFF